MNILSQDHSFSRFLTAGLGVWLALIALLIAQPAQAAPQLLAVAATDVAQPLHCNDGVCAAEFSSFCLQKQRSNPDPGTPYTPYAADSFTLVFTDKAGETHRASAQDLIRISSNRGFTSVVAEIDETTLEQLGAVSAALEAAGNVTLIPVPEAGDHYPITEQEIANAVTTLRPMADEWLSGTQEKAQAVGIVNTLINQTPLLGRLSKTDRNGLWDTVAAYGADEGSSPGTGAVNRAKEMHDACLWRVEIGRYFNMRACLAIKHDSLLQDMNLSYWKATGAGS